MTNYHAYGDEQDYYIHQYQEQFQKQDPHPQDEPQEDKDDPFMKISRGVKAITLCVEDDI